MTDLSEQTKLAEKCWWEYSDSELIVALGQQTYPGAAQLSVAAVIQQCRISGYDPFGKVYHIVPMSVKIAGFRDKYEWRDVVMPGIAKYRIDAARTGQYAGLSEPEFGPIVSTTLDGVDIQYPEWCKITVRRTLSNGAVGVFVALEYWSENYATKGRDTSAPNAMWAKRPRGQLAKCTEAQALRKAFPEIGAQATAEEMEGKSFFDVPEGSYVVDGDATGAIKPVATVEQPVSKSAAPQATASEPAATTQAPAPAKDTPVAKPIPAGMLKSLRAKAEAANVTEDAIREKFGVGFDGITTATFNDVSAFIAA